jgi:alpha-L-fucosidase
MQKDYLTNLTIRSDDMAEEKKSPEEKDRERRLKWFRDMRFGMFIHWGLYAQLGRHEWVMNRERIPIDEYEKLADTWKPKPNCARDWQNRPECATW